MSGIPPGVPVAGVVSMNAAYARGQLSGYLSAVANSQQLQLQSPPLASSAARDNVPVSDAIIMPHVFLPPHASPPATVPLPSPPPRPPPQPPRPPPPSAAGGKPAPGVRKAGQQGTGGTGGRRSSKPGNASGGPVSGVRNGARKAAAGVAKRAARVAAAAHHEFVNNPSASAPAICTPLALSPAQPHAAPALIPAGVPVLQVPAKSPAVAKPLAPAKQLPATKAPNSAKPLAPARALPSPKSSLSLTSQASVSNCMPVAPSVPPEPRLQTKPAGKPNGLAFLLKNTPAGIKVGDSLPADSSISVKGADSRTTKWIVRHHDGWCRLTLSSFYKSMEERALSPTQCARWLVDRTSISLTILEAATRTNELIMMDKSTVDRLAFLTRMSVSNDGKGSEGGKTAVPLLRIAKENAEFLAQYTVLNGFDINSAYRFSYSARKLTDFLQTVTAPDAPIVVALTAVWAFMLSSWQAWALVKSRGRSIPPHFSPIADFLSRDDSLYQLIQTQMVLDDLLSLSANAASGSNSPHVEKAAHTFEQVISLSNDVLHHTMAIGSNSQVPLCVCGRKGHVPSQCTFKSHI